MHNFKIGDIVRCIRSISTLSGGPKNGEIFTVTAVATNGSIGFSLERLNNYYHFDVKSGRLGNWGADCFELAYKVTNNRYVDPRNDQVVAELKHDTVILNRKLISYDE